MLVLCTQEEEKMKSTTRPIYLSNGTEHRLRCTQTLLSQLRLSNQVSADAICTATRIRQIDGTVVACCGAQSSLVWLSLLRRSSVECPQSQKSCEKH